MQQNYNNSFPGFSDESRLWIYPSNRELNGDEIEFVKNEIKSFTADWAAHGKGLLASGDIFENQFIVLVVDESGPMASGCSIDSSVRFIKTIEKELDNSFFDRLHFTILVEDKKMKVHISDLKNYSENLFFNPMITDLGSFRKEFISRIGDSALYKQLSAI